MKVDLPYMSCDEISGWVDSVRDLDHLDADLFRPPVDILHIVEVAYRLDIVPFPDMLDKYHCDAMLMSDFTGIYIDAKEYDSLNNPAKLNNRRLRMSMAHEFGHYILHKPHLEPYIKTLRSPEQYEEMAMDHLLNSARAEWQAWEFAGRLMVPENKLRKIFQELYSKCVENIDLSNTTTAQRVRDEFCRKVGYQFDVNQGVIAKRLDAHGLWPSV